MIFLTFKIQRANASRMKQRLKKETCFVEEGISVLSRYAVLGVRTMDTIEEEATLAEFGSVGTHDCQSVFRHRVDVMAIAFGVKDCFAAV